VKQYYISENFLDHHFAHECSLCPEKCKIAQKSSELSFLIIIFLLLLVIICQFGVIVYFFRKIKLLEKEEKIPSSERAVQAIEELYDEINENEI